MWVLRLCTSLYEVISVRGGPGVMGPSRRAATANVARHTLETLAQLQRRQRADGSVGRGDGQADPHRPWWSTTSVCSRLRRRGGGAVPRVEAGYEKTIDRDLFEHPPLRVRRRDAVVLVVPAVGEFCRGPGAVRRPSADRCPQAARRRPPVRPGACRPRGSRFLPPLQAPRGGPRAAPARSFGHVELRCPCWLTPFLIRGYVEPASCGSLSAPVTVAGALVPSRRHSL